MATGLIVTCAVGFEDLLRGDLQQEHGLRSRLVAPGEILLEDVTDLGFLARTTAIDRVALPWDADASPEVVIAAVQELPGLALDTPVRFRVQASPDARAALIDRYERAGWVNAPGDWQVNLDVELGAAQLGSLAWAARFGTLRRLPAATPVPVVAGLLRLAKCAPQDVLLDPCAGVGTVPIVDAISRRDGRGIAVELQAHAVELAGSNIADRDLAGRIDLVHGDATNLELTDQSVDRVVTDLPFGKRIGSNADNIELYPRVLREIERVLTPSGRCVLLTDDKRVFKDALARTRGLKIVREVVVRYHGVNPSAYVVTRSRKPARPRR
ncbi:MAG: methyltransferase domain-containing protein [Actinomycetota bacterium]|nr:methyltransferase domain-containing protein [Actinomycetota bacterium]